MIIVCMGKKRRGRTISKVSKYGWLIVLVLFGVGVYFYLSDYVTVECEEMSCYREKMLKCEKSSFVNEVDNYVWKYEILSVEDENNCNVKVRLLKIISGGVNSDDIQGMGMVCRVNRYDKIFPKRFNLQLISYKGIIF